MPEEKIRCQFCGRRNHVDNDLCESCGASLPEPDKKVTFSYDDLPTASINISGSYIRLSGYYNPSGSYWKTVDD